MTGDQAFELFCTPRLSTRRSADHEALVKRARRHLGRAEAVRVSTSVGGVQTYLFHPEGAPIANVLVAHGWTGEASFMGAIGDFLRRRGYRAILMDMPAHGQSEGDQASLFDCGRAVLEIAEYFAPVRFAVGHSIGALAVATAGEGHFPLPRAFSFAACVLLAMPDKFTDVTRDFGKEHGLSPEAQQLFEQRLGTLAGRPIANFNGGEMLAAADRPALLLHSRDDHEITIANSENVARIASKARLQAFDGLGHRAILYAPPVVRAAAAFLGEVARSE